MKLFIEYRVKKQKEKYFVQRRFLFFRWTNIGEYDNFYKANMIMTALKYD
jgi:hypothetical protein